MLAYQQCKVHIHFFTKTVAEKTTKLNCDFEGETAIFNLHCFRPKTSLEQNRHFTAISQPPGSLPSFFTRPQEYSPLSSTFSDQQQESSRNNWNDVCLNKNPFYPATHTKGERSEKECEEKRKICWLKKTKQTNLEMWGKTNDKTVVAQRHLHTWHMCT